MAAQGRGPDRTLVHMSPREVQGLQALAMAHGGSLTINPETGLPEAGFLENMLPAIAGFALNAFAPGVGTAVGGLFGLGEAAGTALTVGGISGLASGSLEKGIMAGMGAYGGAGLGASLQNSGTTALTKAGFDAAGGAEALGGDASAIQDTVAKASAFDKIKAGAGAAFSQPKDFLKDNKMNLALLSAPALMGTFDDKTVLPTAQATKKYNMNYVKDPVTGALYDTSGEGVTYGGVGQSTRGMAEGGIVDYDTRTDSQKAFDYLMGKPGAKNPMLFTHQTASEAIKPADFATRTGGKYILDAATNTYVWVPDAGAAGAAGAGTAGLASLQERLGGGKGDTDPKEQARIDAFMDAEDAKDIADGNPFGTTRGARIKDDLSFLSFLNPLNMVSKVVDIFQGYNPVSGGWNTGYNEGTLGTGESTQSQDAATNAAVEGIAQANAANTVGVNDAAANAAANAAQAQANAVAEGNAPDSHEASNPGAPSGGNTDGGECVDPKTHVLLADGSEVQAGALKVGDVVHTLHEDTFEYGDFEVVYAETIQQPKSIVKFTDGSEITASLSHKFLLVDREWKRVDALKEGDAIETAPNVNAEGFKVVASLEQIGTGDVVKLTIDQAHTYISDGLVSHNKFARGGSVRQPNFYKNGKFNFHPAQVYANGGIAALAGGGLGSLGGYSDGGQLLRGPGDGTSDDIPARIGRNQPARLADGEFVVPARIVSELGNGSTDAGARQLYKMLDRIQANRKKTVGKNKTATDSKSARYLPA